MKRLLINLSDSEYNDLKGFYQLGLTTPIYKTIIEKICVEAIANGTTYNPSFDLDKEIKLYKAKAAFYKSRKIQEYDDTARELNFVVELLEKIRSERTQGDGFQLIKDYLMI